MDFVNEIKETFKRGSQLTRLIYINLGVFVLILLSKILLFLFAVPPGTFSLVDILAVPANIPELVIKPWTIVSYMFLHEGFLHILFNMLWLYWFGTIFLRFLSEKQLLNVYLLGGLVGAAFYVLGFNIFPVFENVLPYSRALGASASVMAIVVAISFYSPDFEVYVPFLGPVKIKYIALVFVGLDLMQLPVENSGGHIAHLGGAMWGFWYAFQLKKGKDVGRRFEKIMDWIANLFKPGKKLKVSYKKTTTDIEYNKQQNEKQARIDAILDKIAKSGYESLTKNEKEILFNHSNDRYH